MKYCNKCRTEKAVDEFHRHAARPDGRQSQCKPCMLATLSASKERHPEAGRRASANYANSWKGRQNRVLRLARERVAKSIERAEGLYA